MHIVQRPISHIQWKRRPLCNAKHTHTLTPQNTHQHPPNHTHTHPTHTHKHTSHTHTQKHTHTHILCVCLSACVRSSCESSWAYPPNDSRCFGHRTKRRVYSPHTITNKFLIRNDRTSTHLSLNSYFLIGSLICVIRESDIERAWQKFGRTGKKTEQKRQRGRRTDRPKRDKQGQRQLW